MTIQDKREDIINDICMYISTISDAPLQAVKSQIYMLLHDVEITSRSTEIAVRSEDGNLDYMRRFLVAKTVQGLSRRTIAFYKDTVHKFLMKCGKSVKDVNSDDVRYYFACRQLHDRVSMTTCDNERRNLSSFFRWLTDERLIDRNPMLGIGPIKTIKTKKEALTELEIEKLRNAVRDEREAFVIEFLLSTGCRVSEVVQIMLTDIEDDRILVHGKGAKDRFVYLNTKAKFAMEKYLALRNDTNLYLFAGATFTDTGQCMALAKGLSRPEQISWWKNPEMVNPTTHLGFNAIEVLCRGLAKRAGVKQANPHKFRRTCATMALKRGMSLITVSKMLGHSSVGTTQIYLDISEDDLREAHKKYVI